MQEALVRDAVADAKHKAAYLAEAAGVKLRRIRSIDYRGFGYGGGMEQVTRERAYIAAMVAPGGPKLAYNFTPDDLLFEDVIEIVYEILEE